MVGGLKPNVPSAWTRAVPPRAVPRCRPRSMLTSVPGGKLDPVTPISVELCAPGGPSLLAVTLTVGMSVFTWTVGMVDCSITKLSVGSLVHRFHGYRCDRRHMQYQCELTA